MSLLAYVLVIVVVLAARAVWRGRGGASRVAYDPDAVPVTVVVTIPVDLSPLDRHERFELPLGLALEELGLGELDDADTLADGTARIVITLREARRGLAMILDVLRAVGAPPDTVVRWTSPSGAREERLGAVA